MAKTIRLASGGYITRHWTTKFEDGGCFGFEVGTRDGHDGVLYPDRKEMLAIASLFRRAALKAKKDEPDEYEAPTLKYLGMHDKDCDIPLGQGHVCSCGAEGE